MGATSLNNEQTCNFTLVGAKGKVKKASKSLNPRGFSPHFFLIYFSGSSNEPSDLSIEAPSSFRGFTPSALNLPHAGEGVILIRNLNFGFTSLKAIS